MTIISTTAFQDNVTTWSCDVYAYEYNASFGIWEAMGQRQTDQPISTITGSRISVSSDVVLWLSDGQRLSILDSDGGGDQGKVHAFEYDSTQQLWNQVGVSY